MWGWWKRAAVLKPDSVYQPLKVFLAGRPNDEEQITLTFSEIEDLLGRPLPPGAYASRAFWANNANPGSVSVQAMAWQEAGWRVCRVTRIQQTVTFVQQRG